MLETIKNKLCDGYENLFAGIGGANDNTTHGYYAATSRIELDYRQLCNLYTTSSWAHKVIDTTPNEMTREWMTFTGDIQPEVIQTLENTIDELDLINIFNTAQKLANLYGNSYVVMDIDDGLDPYLPISTNLKEGCLRSVRLLDRTELSGSKTNLEVFGDNYNEFEEYSINGTSIHRSRIIIFRGVVTTGYQRKMAGYYDNSVLSCIYDDILAVSAAENAIASHIISGTTDVMMIEGFKAGMASDSQQQTVDYISKILRTKSLHNCIVLDKEDEVTTLSKNTTDAQELFTLKVKALAAKANIPISIFLGEQETGLANTGQASLKNYYDVVSREQENKFTHNLQILLSIISCHCGLSLDADELAFEWCSLFQMDEKEQAEINKLNAESYSTLIEEGVLQPFQVAKELQQSNFMSNIEGDYVFQLEKAFNEAELVDDDVDNVDKGENDASTTENSSTIEKEETTNTEKDNSSSTNS